MKHLFRNLLGAVLAASVLTACDEIKEDDRYIAVEGVTPVRSVLIEDFTGQNCVNCPASHAVIEKLVEQYGDKVIPVSIHAGGFGVSVESSRLPSYVGLMQPEGNTLNDRYGINEWPKGVINGRGGAKNPDEWAAAVRDEIAKDSPLAIEVEARYNAESNSIEIETSVIPHSDLNAKLKIWVTESNIVAFQRDINLGRIPDYVHNHVYRASVTALDGDPVSLRSNYHSTLNHSIAVRDNDKEKWDVNSLSIVAFIADESGVLQAASTKVITE